MASILSCSNFQNLKTYLNPSLKMRHLTVEQRAQIVGMSLAGSSNKSIARAFAIDMKTVARWINRYHHQQNFQRLPGSGRKPKIDKRMARRVGQVERAELMYMSINDFTTHQILD